ncbi:MAG TPA: hypothetical protein VJW76_06535 [Verrucomicrobiae bacterium]|nr:hypothetical protein [Verrucomicrobiae bacterium]
MNTLYRAALPVAAVAATLLVPVFSLDAAAPTSPQGVITAREFLDIGGGTAVADLTNNAKFPNSPDLVAYPARFEWPTGPDDATPPAADLKNNYGTQIIGYFYPATTGPHTFYLAADDGAVLYLSTDSDPANKKLIAVETAWSPVRGWESTAGGSVLESKNSSTYTGSQWPGGGTAINLTQGQPYYIEALAKEGIGGDNLAVSIDNSLPISGAQLSTIDRASVGQPFLSDFNGSGGGIWYYLIEPTDTVNQGTVQLALNGSNVTPTFTKIGTNLTISFRVAAPLAIGSTNTSTLNFTDSAGRPQAIQKTFVVAAYASVPPAYKTATFSGDGFGVFVHQIEVPRGPGDANSIANGEQHLADGFIDPLTGQPYANLASPPTTTTTTVVNWEQLAGDINLADPTAAGQPDSFNAYEPDPPNGPRPNASIPGIPGSATAPDDNIAAAITAFVELAQGWNRLGVNSDDGFILRASPGLGEVIGGQVLGSFNGGRGASDSLADFWVQEAGVYPVRLAWWEGGSGANIEFYSENIESRRRILVNDRATAGHAKAYPTGQGRAYVQSVLPANGFTGANTNIQIRIALVDGLTTVVDGSVSLVFDGAAVAATVANGPTTTVTYSVPGAAAFGSSHTGSLIWTESTTPPTVWTNNFSFSVRFQGIGDLPASSFWIEAEDFNHSGGQTMPAASTMPYAGNAYDQLGAVIDIDYQRPQEVSSDLYRVGEDPNVPMDGNQTAGTLDTQRPGGFEVTSNYKMGWTAGGAWYNYTRTIPAGLYSAFGAFSHGDVAADVGGSLQRVTAGETTTSQTVVQLGTFSGPAPGGWGANTLVPLRDATGGQGVFKLPGGPVTIRLTTRNGDYDWFTLIPVSGVPPSVVSITPPLDLTVYRNAVFTWTIEDFSTAVQTNSITLSFGGVNVTPQLSITKPATDRTVVSFTPAQLLNAGTNYPFELVFRDNGTPQTIKTNSGTVVTHYLPRTAVDGAFAIEAEDFNHTSGQVIAAANTMPYLGGAYDTLSAVAGVDYQRNGNEPSGDVYRLTENPNVPMGGATATNQEQPGTVPDVNRAGWDITNSFSLGWAGGGHWMNYTRQIPANTYQVWAAMSYGGTGANLLQGNLLKVTAGATTPSQTTEPVGVFRGAGTAGWGANTLVPMRENAAATAIKTVQFSGETTLRFENVSGDFDYLMLIPVGPSGPVLNQPTLSGNTVTISWTGTGTLQETDSLSPPNWTTAPSQANPQTVSASGVSKYYRLQQ